MKTKTIVWIVVGVITLLTLVIVAIIGFFYAIQTILKSSDAYQQSIDFINSDMIETVTGEVIEIRPFVMGSVSKNFSNGVASGEADFRIKFQAENGNYVISISLSLDNEQWDIDHYRLTKLKK